MRTTAIWLAAALLIGLASVPADAATYVVPGTADPFLAGMPSGSTCCFGDSAPAESPVYAGAVTGGAKIAFTDVSGSVSYAGGTPTDPPIGNLGFLIDTPAYEGGATVINGIAGYQNAPADALIGVFLGPSLPTLTPASTELDLSAGTLTPGLQQVFYIGEGFGYGQITGTPLDFTVPIGATRLYLGTVDGFGWYNNTGDIDVTVNAVSSVPEPALWGMMLLGVSLLGVGLRMGRRKHATALAAA
jgi:PEP-CTERM motif